MTLPQVTVHYAQTLDGRIATRTGHSQWISGPETLKFAHSLRAEHQAVLVGVGTVLADNPQLTVRLVPGRSPFRVVVDSTLRTPLEARLVTDGTIPTLLATIERASETRQDAFRQAGVEVLTIAEDGAGRVSLPALFAALSERGIASVLVEGGSGIITSLLCEQLVDRLIICIAPKIVGAGIEAVGDLGIRHMGDALRLTGVRIERMGDELVVEGIPVYGVLGTHDAG